MPNSIYYVHVTANKEQHSISLVPYVAISKLVWSSCSGVSRRASLVEEILVLEFSLDW
jgi:hypothetical protein